MLGNNLRDILKCPVCKNLMRTPVTLICGHSFCRICVTDKQCSVCVHFVDSGTPLATNVLIQGLINKCCGQQPNTGCEIGNSDLKKSSTSLVELPMDTKLRRRLSRVYKKRGIAHLRESIAAFCLSTICHSPNQSSSSLVSKVLNDLLSSKRSLRTRCQTSGPYPCTRVPERRSGVLSDSEDGSSSDEENTSMVYGTSELKRLIEKIVKEFEKVKREKRHSPSPSKRPPSLTTIANELLECVLCSRCLLEPVTTGCGHTFCRGCLERVLDYGLACPLCVAPLNRNDLFRTPTVALENVLKLLAPTEYIERVRLDEEEIGCVGEESQIPVFVCTTAFPNVACPLFVYEPRYRLLARRCLQSRERTFAMAAATSKTGSSERFAPYGTLLEIRDAVNLQDGCSILTTIGMRRFKVLDRGEKDGYDTASVQYIRDRPVTVNQIPALITLHDKVLTTGKAWVNSLGPGVLAEVEYSLGAMPSPELNWHLLPDGPSWAWWLMAILPLGIQLQVGILGTTSLEKRLRALDKALEHVSARMKALENNSLSCESQTVDQTDTCQFMEQASRQPMEL